MAGRPARQYLGLDASTQSLSAVVIEVAGDGPAKVVLESSLNFDQALPHYGRKHAKKMFQTAQTPPERSNVGWAGRRTGLGVRERVQAQRRLAFCRAQRPATNTSDWLPGPAKTNSSAPTLSGTASATPRATPGSSRERASGLQAPEGRRFESHHPL